MRRTPATYDRILKHIAGHQITVHCTVTRQQVQRDGYLEEFLRLWSASAEVAQDLVSLYTPQVGEVVAEIAVAADRERVVADAHGTAAAVPEAGRCRRPDRDVREAARSRPDECIFARTTTLSRRTSSTASRRASSAATPDCAQLRLHRVGRAGRGRRAIGCPAAHAASARSSNGPSRSAMQARPARSRRWASRAQPPDILSGCMPRLRHDQPQGAVGARVRCAGSRDTAHPLLVQIIPIRRCNIDCGYCNEYDKVSQPVPTDAMLRAHRQARGPRHVGRRVQRRRADAASGPRRPDPPHPQPRHDGRPHHQRLLPVAEAHRGAERGRPRLPADQHRQRRAGRSLEEEPAAARQEAAAAARPRRTSTSTSTRCSAAASRTPKTRARSTTRARELGFSTSIGIIHDGSGRLKPLGPAERKVYDEVSAAISGRWQVLQEPLFRDPQLPGQPRRRQAERLALPRRRALSLRLRRRAGPLLLAAARLSRRAARDATPSTTSAASS